MHPIDAAKVYIRNRHWLVPLKFYKWNNTLRHLLTALEDTDFSHVWVRFEGGFRKCIFPGQEFEELKASLRSKVEAKELLRVC